MNLFIISKGLVLALLSIFVYNVYIKVFKGLKQTEREEGLERHKTKNGTITMGGIIFIILPLFFISYDEHIKVIVIGLLGFGIIGFIDDLLIIFLKKNDGLKAYVKLIIEVIIASLIFFMYLKLNFSTKITLFNIEVDLKWFFGILILWLLTASSNAWNLTDGVDGLCAGFSIIIGLGLMAIAYKKAEYAIFNLLFFFNITLFVFWCLNFPKAFLFMGDVGSLALGAFYASISIFLNCILSFAIISGIFIFETISVMLQVFYYKKTKGKRLFKMAPFHHHLEACGLNEIQIDLILYSIQVVLVIIGFVII